MISFFFFNDTATTEIYTLSLHDALPIYAGYAVSQRRRKRVEEIFGWLKTVGLMRKTRHRGTRRVDWMFTFALDRKSTRLNSSHSQISYAVFCLKKKKNHI